MTPTDLKIERTPDGALLLTLAGDWKLGNIGPSQEGALAQLSAGEKARQLAFATGGLKGWDSGLLIFLAKLFAACRSAGVAVDESGLPAGVRKLLALASPE